VSRISPYGTWSSPITAAEVAAAGGGPQWLDVVSGEVWWAEARPGEQGRVALVKAGPGGTQDVLPAPWNVRNRLHEYGGRPWAVAGGVVVFTHWADQRVYAVGETGVVPITPEPAEPQGVRYGDLVAGRPGEVWAVRERAVGPRPTDVSRELVAIALDGGGEVAAEGAVDIESAKTQVVNLINNFFRDRLTAMPTIKDYMDRVGRPA